MRRLSLKILLGAVLFAGLVAGIRWYFEKAMEESDTQLINGKIIKVVDGDTMDVEMDGREERVRLMLVDSPEIRSTSEPAQPFSTEASVFAKNTLQGHEVRLETEGSTRDPQGHLLVYLWMKDSMFNEMLLQRGLARVTEPESSQAGGGKYVSEFRSIEENARKRAVGIWSIKDYVRQDGYHPEVLGGKHDRGEAQEQ